MGLRVGERQHPAPRGKRAAPRPHPVGGFRGFSIRRRGRESEKRPLGFLFDFLKKTILYKKIIAIIIIISFLNHLCSAPPSRSVLSRRSAGGTGRGCPARTTPPPPTPLHPTPRIPPHNIPPRRGPRSSLQAQGKVRRICRNVAQRHLKFFTLFSLSLFSMKLKHKLNFSAPSKGKSPPQHGPGWGHFQSRVTALPTRCRRGEGGMRRSRLPPSQPRFKFRSLSPSSFPHFPGAAETKTPTSP